MSSDDRGISDYPHERYQFFPPELLLHNYNSLLKIKWFIWPKFPFGDPCKVLIHFEFWPIRLPGRGHVSVCSYLWSSRKPILSLKNFSIVIVFYNIFYQLLMILWSIDIWITLMEIFRLYLCTVFLKTSTCFQSHNNMTFGLS